MVATDEMGEIARRFAPPVLELEFETSEAATTFRALWSAQPGAAPADAEGMRLRIGTADLAQARAAALRLIAAHDLPLSRLGGRSASLEDVFVRLVGGTS